MAKGTDLVWTAQYNTDLQMYEPQRQTRRFTQITNSFENRAMAQAACDKKNLKSDRATPLEMFPDKTPAKPDLI